jgi:hypothetical protein
MFGRKEKRKKTEFVYHLKFRFCIEFPSAANHQEVTSLAKI